MKEKKKVLKKNSRETTLKQFITAVGVKSVIKLGIERENGNNITIKIESESIRSRCNRRPKDMDIIKGDIIRTNLNLVKAKQFKKPCF